MRIAVSSASGKIDFPEAEVVVTERVGANGYKWEETNRFVEGDLAELIEKYGESVVSPPRPERGFPHWTLMVYDDYIE